METCKYTLESYISKLPHDVLLGNKKLRLLDNKKWAILQKLCQQVTSAIADLHRQNFHLVKEDGNSILNPLNVFVQDTQDCPILKVVLPGQVNQFNENSDEYSIKWPGEWGDDAEKCKNKDKICLASILYYIQTCGENIKKHLGDDATTWNENDFNVPKSWKIYCKADKSNDSTQRVSEFRKWKISLARDLIVWALKEVEHLQAHQLLKHPYFWNASYVLTFIQNVADYLEMNENIRTKFTKISVDVGLQLKGYPDILKFIGSNGEKTRPLGNKYKLLKGIRDKVTISFMKL